MSDHWNSLANLLGTPSVEPIQRKPSATGQNIKRSQITPKMERPESSRDNDTAVDSDLRSSEPVPTIESLPPTPIEPSPTLAKRSSWDTLARLFGVGGSTESRTQETAIPTIEPTPSTGTVQSARPARANRPSMFAPNETPQADSSEAPIDSSSTRREASTLSQKETLRERPRDSTREDGANRNRRDRPDSRNRESISRTKESKSTPTPFRGQEPRQSNSSQADVPQVGDSDAGIGQDDVVTGERHGGRRRVRRVRNRDAQADLAADVKPRDSFGDRELDRDVRDDRLPKRVRDSDAVVNLDDELPSFVDETSEIESERNLERAPARRRRRRRRPDKTSDRVEGEDTESVSRVLEPRRSIEGETERRPSRRQPRTANRESDDSTTSDSVHDEFEDDFELDSDDNSLRPKHAKIPTWAEAIATMVEPNIQNRRKNPNPSVSRRRPPRSGPHKGRD